MKQNFAHVNNNILAQFLFFSLYAILGFSAINYVYERSPQNFWTSDSSSYHNGALSILQIGKFSEHPDHPEKPQFVRTPGYSIFIACIYWIFGVDIRNLLVAQVIICILTLFLIYQISKILWRNGTIAYFTLIITALDPVTFLFTQKILTETIFSFFVVLAAFAGVNIVLKLQTKIKWALLLGISLAVATLIRPINYYLVFLIIIYLVIFLGNVVRVNWRTTILVVICVFLPSILFIGGWQIRNLIFTGKAEYSYIKGINLYYYRVGGVIALKDGKRFDEVLQQLLIETPLDDSKPIAQRDELYKDKAFFVLSEHPFLFFRTMVNGITKLTLSPAGRSLPTHFGFGSPEDSIYFNIAELTPKDYWHKWVIAYPFQYIFIAYSIVHLFILYAGFLSGISKSLSNDAVPLLGQLFLLSLVAYFSLLPAGPEANVRFRVPIIPFLSVFSGGGFYFLLIKIRKKLTYVLIQLKSLKNNWPHNPNYT